MIISSKSFLVYLLLLTAVGVLAEVRTVEFNPPLAVAAGEFAGSPLGLGKLGVDFNLDGRAELNLVYGADGINVFLNSSNRVVTKGSVAAISFGTAIGSNLPPDLITYQWGSGLPVSTNSELRQFGDRKAKLLTTLTSPRLPGSPMQTAGGGTPITQPVLASGDIVGKEGAIAVEFYINSFPHYGYIHFDFRTSLGSGGYIRGWAYETSPDVSIMSKPIGRE